MDYWYHGTMEHFSKWGNPPNKSKYTQGLYPHSFVSLTKDKVLANNAGEKFGGLCRAKLHEEAKVLDLRVPSDDNIEHWKMVKSSDVGRHHSYALSFDLWLIACRNGTILRLHSTNDKLLSPLEEQMRIANSEKYPIKQRKEARLKVHNFTRKWIDTVMNPAQKLGYHAVICSEMDSRRPSGPAASLNLHVFNVNMLTDPEWVSMPDVSHVR